VVADGGPTSVQNFTGWNLKDTGMYDQMNAMTGLAVNLGNFQIGPNVLVQKPIIGPIPNDPPDPGRKRNVVEDPFAVRQQREMVGAEIILSHDPTPATWMWAWDNDVREDARLAWSVGFIARHFPTTLDAGIGVLEDGQTFFAFPNATPPRDLMWDVTVRTVSSLGYQRRLVTRWYAGTGEANGDDPRLIDRYGVDARLSWGTFSTEGFAKVGDWGPFDYHRDFNMTFPVHFMLDLSHSLGAPRWFSLPSSRLGVRGVWRSLDRYSNRYQPDGAPELPDGELYPEGLPGGSEWEFRTYFHVTL
jgi:hypothetical protein